MLKKLLLTINVLSLLSSPAQADDPPPEDDKPCEKDDPRPQCLFDFDPDGKVHPKDPRAERVFEMPPLKTGFLVDVRAPDVVLYVSIQLLHWNIFGEDFAITAGAAPSRAIMTLDWEVIPIMRIGPNIWGGYNVPEKEWTFGAGFTILKF